MSLKLAAIFKDFMVVQRNRPITVFGTGVPKTVVTVSLHTSFSKTVVAADGTWCATLPPLAAGTDYVLTVSDGTTEEQRKQVAVGEVWLAGGQSNMELALRDSADGVAVSKAYTGTQIRFYQVPKRAVLDETHQQLEAQSAWKIAAAENVGDLSAVAFYFAKRLAQKMDCVIGIVDCYWGGTSIACWMSESMMQSVAAGQKQLADYKAEVGAKTPEQYAAEMREYEWAEEMRERRERDERLRGQSEMGKHPGTVMPPVVRSRPSFDAPDPVKRFYVEVELEHPYWTERRWEFSAPSFSSSDPSINDYMDSYQEKVDKLHELAVNLMQAAFGNVQEISESTNTTFQNPAGQQVIIQQPPVPR